MFAKTLSASEQLIKRDDLSLNNMSYETKRKLVTNNIVSN